MNSVPNEGSWFVASLILLVVPAELNAVKAVLQTMPAVEIYAEQPDEGKLVVVVSAEVESELESTMEALERIRGVMAASLIYSQRDLED